MKLRQRITSFLEQRCATHQQRLRLITFMLLCTTIIVLGVPMHMCGIIGSTSDVLYVVSAVSWTLTLLIFALYLLHRLSLQTSLATLAVSLQLAESMRIAFAVIERPEGFVNTIIFNQIISLALIIYLVIAFAKYLPLINTVLSLATLTFAYTYTDGAISRQILTIFIFVEIFTCLLGYFTRRGVSVIQRENTDYNTTQNSLLEAFNMSKTELVAYLQLCRNKDMTSKDINNFFDHLDEQTEANLIRTVEKRIAERKMQHCDITSCLPSLTPTETEVCRLIIGGKTLSEIANILNKSTNNISSVRIHIRKKLQLQTNEDLREALLKMFENGK